MMRLRSLGADIDTIGRPAASRIGVPEGACPEVPGVTKTTIRSKLTVALRPRLAGSGELRLPPPPQPASAGTASPAAERILLQRQELGVQSTWALGE